MRIGIVGNGFVGKSMTLFRPHVEVLVWDIDPSKREPISLSYKEFANTCQLIFIAVPTPMRGDGSCDMSIVTSVVQDLKQVTQANKIVIRSTVPPGTSDRLGVSFIPEFLTEKNWEDDFRNCKQWILGSSDKTTETKVKQLFDIGYADGKGCVATSSVIVTDTKVAEMIKYGKNCFLSTKVSFFNELYDICQELGCDFSKVRKFVCDDDRIGHGHSKVPGHDGKRGFGGTCFPKDMNALKFFAETLGVDSILIASAIERNETIDRPEKDWQNDKGRAVSDE